MNKARPQDDGPYYLVVENEHGSDKAVVKLFVTDPQGLDFRGMLKHREYEQWGKEQGEGAEEEGLKPPEPGPPGRRMSIRPDKKADSWVKELVDIRVQQTVDRQAVFNCEFSTGKAKIKWMMGRKEIFPVSLFFWYFLRKLRKKVSIFAL